MCLCGRQNKDNMGWRFFQCLEQSVRRFLGEHVNFIYNVDFVAGLVGGVVDFLPQVTDFINTAIAGSVNFNNIQGPPLGYCLAHGAGIAGLPFTTGQTIDGFGQDTPGTCFTSTPGTAEKIGMRYMTTAQGVMQRLGYVFLTDYLS